MNPWNEDRPTLHDPKECESCANDPEQCHAAIDCNARAWSNGYCGPHQPDPKVYR